MKNGPTGLVLLDRRATVKSMDPLKFYENLVPLRDFRQIIAGENFTAAPDDWYVVMTDVKGSTKALQAGRYRDVNTLGASGITAVLNALPDVDIPYVFGGDGATLLVPGSRLEKVIAALKSTQKMSRDLFQLELRAGAVAIARLRADGYEVEVAKYELSPGNALAQFRGGGIARAEELLKSNSDDGMTISPDPGTGKPDLTGLSCRWQPFTSEKGTMLTLLVVDREPKDTSSHLYSKLLEEIERLLGTGLKDVNPVHPYGLKGKFFSGSWLREAKLHSSGRIQPAQLLKYAVIQLFSSLCLKFNIAVGGFDPHRYRRETAMNADYKKFDDMLRMVVDCSVDQAEKIEAMLIGLHAEGKIHYGIHRSPAAVMTCFVVSASENQHVHFVDGSNGGYAMAAKSMKARMGKAV